MPGLPSHRMGAVLYSLYQLFSLDKFWHMEIAKLENKLGSNNMNTKRLSLLLVLLLGLILCTSAIYASANREIWLTEDFSSTTFPPTGWSISSNATNWSRFAGNSAGGTSPELRFSWEPQFNGTSYFISPMVNTSGETSVFLDFRHFVDHYANPFTIGVATRSNGGAWNVAWSLSPTGNVGPLLQTVEINNADVGSSQFQFAFYFSGSSYNVDYWFIDNVKLYTPFAFDLGIFSVTLPAQVEAGEPLNPVVVIKNYGMNDLTATVSVTTYQWETVVANEVDFYVGTLAAGAEATINAPFFLPETENELYRFVYSITSLEDVIDGDPSNNVMEKSVATWTTAKQNVLLELGTGGWCPYCPGAAMAADDMVALGYNVAVIENHNGDPYATDTSNARNSYYGITGYPTGIFDGLLRYVGGSNSTSIMPAYLPLFNQRVNLKTPIELNIYGTNNGNNYSIDVRIQKLANLADPNLVLHLALTESEIQYSWQGQTHMNFVNRLMAPNHLGTEINLMNAPIGEESVLLNFTKGATWVDAHCELVAFVQNLDTKEVIQAQKISLLDLEAPPVSNDDYVTNPVQTRLGAIYPNPFNPQTTIGYSLNARAQVRMDVYNVKGQLVNTLLNAEMPAGNHSLVWQGTDSRGNNVSSGIYYVRMNSENYSTSRKVMLLK